MNHDNPTNEPNQQETPYVPNRKKETMKIWFLTIILHLIIGLSLLAYWHFYYQPKNQPIIQPTIDPTETVSTPMKSNIVIASLVASATLASTTTTTMASTPHASAPKIVKQNKVSVTTDKPVTTPTQKTTMPNQAPVVPPIPQKTTVTTTITEKVVHEAPVTQALTERDIPTIEKPKHSVAVSEQNKEAVELSDDIDAKNKELSELINQVKKQNQQKIEKEVHNPFTTQENPPTKKVDSQDEKSNEVDNTEKNE